MADTLSCIPQNKELMTSEEIFTVVEEHNANKQKRKGVKNVEHKKCAVDIYYIQGSS